MLSLPPSPPSRICESGPDFGSRFAAGVPLHEAPALERAGDIWFSRRPVKATRHLRLHRQATGPFPPRAQDPSRMSSRDIVQRTAPGTDSPSGPSRARCGAARGVLSIAHSACSACSRAGMRGPAPCRQRTCGGRGGARREGAQVFYALSSSPDQLEVVLGTWKATRIRPWLTGSPAGDRQSPLTCRTCPRNAQICTRDRRLRVNGWASR